jgi:hypothetical protein
MKQSLFHICVLAVLIFTAITTAQAQATRTWVSGVGDDANPCSRTAPCKTFAGAISKTAAGGEIDCLDPGGFGAVGITKSITLDCSGTYGSILVSSGGSAISINNASIIVRLRGLSLTGQNAGAYGVRITAASRVTIEDSIIDGFTDSGVFMEAPGDAAAPQLFISNTTIRNNTVNGLNVTSAGASPSRVAIIRSQIYGSSEGIIAQNADIAVTDCLIAGNNTGIRTAISGTVRISGNTISGNTTNFNTPKGAILTYGNNALTGNGTNNAPSGTVVPAGLQ